MAESRKELKAAWKTDVEVPELTLDDVAKHNTKGDLWLVIHGGVYNLTEYARDHPGGAEVLLETAGTDATSAYEDIGHSEDAREIMHPFLVGRLKGHISADASNNASSQAVVPVVTVVRQSPTQQKLPKAVENKPSTSLNHYGELAAFALGTTSLAWFVSQPATWRTISQLANTQSSHGGFLQGFVLASGTSLAVSVASIRYLQRITKMDADPFHLPPHRASSHVTVSSHYPVGVLAPSEYRKFKLRSKTELSKGIWKFVIALPSPTSVLGLPIGQHVAIRGQVGEHTVTRSYTPISNNRDLGRLELLIRLYPDGQLSSYLQKLQVGEELDIRGPKGAMKYRKGISKRLGMVGGGTGITPLYQLIRAICEDPTDNMEISLVYANRSESDIMLREQMDKFAAESEGRFKIHYMLDNPPEGWKGGRGYVSKAVLQERMPAPAPDTKIMLCGPPGMVKAVEKALVELGFEKPGAVAKMSDQIFLF